MNFKKTSERYRQELLGRVLPFWMDHSVDRECGGYFSCLNRDGSIYDTDKFVWLQGREIWMFAMLYNQLEKRRDWLDTAVHGAEFLKKYGHDGSYDFYFSLDRQGRPLVQPYNIFSNTFACMAFAQLAKATGNAEYAEIARRDVPADSGPPKRTQGHLGKDGSGNPGPERVRAADDHLQHGPGNRGHHRRHDDPRRHHPGLPRRDPQHVLQTRTGLHARKRRCGRRLGGRLFRRPGDQSRARP